MALNQSTSKEPGRVTAENDSVTVIATLTELLHIPCHDLSYLGIELVSETSAEFQDALDQFEVAVQFHENGAFQVLYNTGGAFTSPAGLVVDASGDLTLLAYQASGWLLLNVLPVYSVRIRAASDALGDGTGVGLALTARATGKS